MCDRKDLLEVVGPLYRSLRRIEDQCADTADLSMWQYAILSMASGAEGLSQGVIAQRLGYSKNRIVGDLDHLTERGFAERRAGGDRRSNAIHVTPAGRAIVEDLRRQIWQREDELLAHMSADHREIMLELLKATADALKSSPATVGAKHVLDVTRSDL
jgi:DNA-binding MarR family transcriptional regulator